MLRRMYLVSSDYVAGRNTISFSSANATTTARVTYEKRSEEKDDKTRTEAGNREGTPARQVG